MELTISSNLTAALALQLVVVVGAPIFLLIRWYKRSRGTMLPAVVGMVVYMVFGQALTQILHYAFLMSSNPIAETISGNPWIYAIYLGLVAGLCEETGRYMGFKYLLKRYPQRDTAICCGIGHGGYECVAVAGLSTLSYLVLAAFINSGAIPEILAMYSPAQASLIEEVLAQVAAITPFQCLWSSIERVIALAMHLSMSVLVFAAVRQAETHAHWYLVAMALHALTVIPAGLYQSGVLSGNRGMVAAILLNLLVTLVAAFLARRLWRQLPEAVVEAEPPEEPKFPM